MDADVGCGADVGWGADVGCGADTTPDTAWLAWLPVESPWFSCRGTRQGRVGEGSIIANKRAGGRRASASARQTWRMAFAASPATAWLAWLPVPVLSPWLSCRGRDGGQRVGDSEIATSWRTLTTTMCALPVPARRAGGHSGAGATRTRPCRAGAYAPGGSTRDPTQPGWPARRACGGLRRRREAASATRSNLKAAGGSANSGKPGTRQPDLARLNDY